MSMNLAIALGPVPTLWSSDGIGAAWAAGKDLILQAKPKAVQLHSWEPRPTIDRIRVALAEPELPAIVGVGVDGIAKRIAKGEWSEERGVQTCVELARRAEDCGAAALKFNAEGGWKRPPTSDEAKRLKTFIRVMLAAVRRAFPRLALWFTSYDHPSFHSAFPWLEWLGRDSPITESYWQVYAAGLGKEVNPHRGKLAARVRSSIASYQKAIRDGWIKADVPDGQPGDDVGLDWRPYVQLHHVDAADTIALVTMYPTAAMWAVPTRADAHGRFAFLAACELHRRGFWGQGAVAQFQLANNLAPDGVVGPLTANALGLADSYPRKKSEALIVQSP